MKRYTLSIIFLIIFLLILVLDNLTIFAKFSYKDKEQKIIWKIYNQLFSRQFLEDNALNSFLDIKIVIRNLSFEKGEIDAKEYVRIFMQFQKAPGRDQQKWIKFCLKMVNDYKNFIQQYPRSLLVDDAKLRIAEYYHAAGMKYKAKYWLEDLIKNHSKDNYCIVKIFELKIGLRRKYIYYFEEDHNIKTVAWALFYRGYWFGEKKYLEQILKEYPNGTPAKEAGDVLKEWKVGKN